MIRMRLLNLSFALALAAALLTAQQPAGKGKAAPQPPKEFASAAEVQAMMAKAKNDRKDGQAIVNQNILRLAPYQANLEYRASVGPASQHDTEAEMFYVVEGSGTLVTGGTMPGATKTGDNWSGASIEGGNTRAVGKGDFIMVPEKTPHWFSKIDGVLVLMSIHLPHTN
jgi:mannose-6-phosphate isomerase-like protein (cupin superfamily)